MHTQYCKRQNVASIEDKIYATLAKRKDYTEFLFEKENCTNG